MSNCFAIEDLIPVVDPTAYVHPTAVLIGDVIVGPRCYVGPAACLRGDFGRIILENGANVQDTCVMHGFPNTDTVIGEDGHIGHGSVVHGANIGRDALVGMNAVIMDYSQIGESAIIGAMAFVPEGTIIPARTLALGIPAKPVRELSDEEIKWKRAGTREYQVLAERSLKTQRPVEPLTAPQENRPRYVDSASITLGATKEKSRAG